MSIDRPSIFFSDDIINKPKDIKDKFYYHLEYSMIKDRSNITARDLYQALALTLKDNLIDKWLKTNHTFNKKSVKKVRRPGINRGAK